MAELFEQMLELTPMTLPGFRASLWNALICSPFAAGPYELAQYATRRSTV